jgi:glycosyltransferase involved in cell wall biosynthesis
MLIGVDASRAVSARPTGTENYSLHLIRALLSLDTQHRFRLYFNQPPPSGLFRDNVDQRVLPFPRLWTHVRLSWEMLTQPPGLLFVPSHVLPVVHPRRSIVTVHDLGYLYYPETHTLTQNLYLRWSTRHNARSAARVLADSEATRRDLIRRYGIASNKIRVVYPGRDPSLAPTEDPALIADVHARYDVRGPYILYVGTLHPRKNLVRLIQAFSQLLQTLAANPQPPARDVQLVLAGQRGWLYHEIFAEVRRLALEDRVILTGYVPDTHLAALLSGASAFVYPSLHEGFGLPVLEAMACGAPVVCSNTSSLPEVAGDAALLVDPLDVQELSVALHRILTDQDLRRTLVRRGFSRCELFSWQRCARDTLQVLESVGHGLY